MSWILWFLTFWSKINSSWFWFSSSSSSSFSSSNKSHFELFFGTDIVSLLSRTGFEFVFNKVIWGVEIGSFKFCLFFDRFWNPNLFWKSSFVVNLYREFWSFVEWEFDCKFDLMFRGGRSSEDWMDGTELWLDSIFFFGSWFEEFLEILSCLFLFPFFFLGS